MALGYIVLWFPGASRITEGVGRVDLPQGGPRQAREA